MRIVGRVAREFGAGSPMFLARQYGLLDSSFFESLEPFQLVLADNVILNNLIEFDNEAQKMEEDAQKERDRMPGVTRMVSASERSAQLKAMLEEKRD
jgi:hypothetical protein